MRHSFVARSLLRGLPIKLVADLVDSSTAIIERHYARFIVRHSDDLVRAVLLDTSPPSPQANVVPLRA